MTESRSVLPAFYMGLIFDNDYLTTKLETTHILSIIGRHPNCAIQTLVGIFAHGALRKSQGHPMQMTSLLFVCDIRVTSPHPGNDLELKNYKNRCRTHKLYVQPKQEGERSRMIGIIINAIQQHFYPRDAMLARVIEIATCLSVCLSVSLCVRPSRAGIVSKRRILAA